MVNRFVEAARPRTLPAAVAPVLVGTAAAATPAADLNPVRAGLALVVALALQVAVNYANDYFDGVKGVDTAARVGPRRAVVTGLVTAAEMRRAIAVSLVVAGAAGLTVAALAGWEVLIVGLAAILATLAYSGGPKPYASAALGEVFVFLFFGIVATAGSAYVQDGELTVLALLAAVPVGAFATALLVVNNLRDIPTDRHVGKRTLAVRLGEQRTRRLFVILVVGAYVMLAPIAVITGSPWLALPVLSVMAAWPGIELVRHAPVGPRLIEALGRTARAQLVFAVLLTAGLVLAEITTSTGGGS
jgi:1,4-dihydroxy-2-naphthoate octaprenyltransferase